MHPSLFRRPSAVIPVAMSCAALLLVLGHIALSGSAREADEGTAAHLFQMLMAAQVPVIAWFALTGLQRAPAQALRVLLVQILAAAAAFVPVFYFDL